jgi:hypothetical protein
MQDSIRAGETQSRLSNPLFDLAIAGLEAQLKAWQAYQVEGTRFVSKRLRSNLEHLRALGHCCDMQSTGECQRAWLKDIQKDCTEEWGRVAATSFALAFGELSAFGSLFERGATTEPAESKAAAKASQPAKSSKPGLQAAA